MASQARPAAQSQKSAGTRIGQPKSTAEWRWPRAQSGPVSHEAPPMLRRKSFDVFILPQVNSPKKPEPGGSVSGMVQFRKLRTGGQTSYRSRFGQDGAV